MRGLHKFDQETVYQDARKWVEEAGEVIRAGIDQPREIATKDDPNDLVTEMDRKVEEFFAEKIRNQYPDDVILSVEGFGDEVNSVDGTVWMFDTIVGMI